MLKTRKQKLIELRKTISYSPHHPRTYRKLSTGQIISDANRRRYQKLKEKL